MKIERAIAAKNLLAKIDELDSFRKTVMGLEDEVKGILFIKNSNETVYVGVDPENETDLLEVNNFVFTIEESITNDIFEIEAEIKKL